MHDRKIETVKPGKGAGRSRHALDGRPALLQKRELATLV
jgi:hypothetical protein